jgi:hypothetical protein
MGMLEGALGIMIAGERFGHTPLGRGASIWGSNLMPARAQPPGVRNLRTFLDDRQRRSKFLSSKAQRGTPAGTNVRLNRSLRSLFAKH